MALLRNLHDSCAYVEVWYTFSKNESDDLPSQKLTARSKAALTLYSWKSHCVLLSTPSSSMLLTRDLTFPTTIDARNGLYFLLLAFLRYVINFVASYSHSFALFSVSSLSLFLQVSVAPKQLVSVTGPTNLVQFLLLHCFSPFLDNTDKYRPHVSNSLPTTSFYVARESVYFLIL